MKYIVNIIVRGEHHTWQEIISLRDNKKITYIFSENPVAASFHIFLYEVETCEVFNYRERIALVLGEPPEIRRNSSKFLDQFGAIFSANFDYLIDRSNFVSAQGMLPRMAGLSMGAQKQNGKSFNELVGSRNIRKTDVSVIQSGKRITKLQKKRIKFINKLAVELPEISILGRDHNYVDDKSLILLNSQYTVAIENSVHAGYWTEKLLDPILCGATCFYYGDPDISKSFKSPILIDIDDFEKSFNIIRAELQKNERDTKIIQEDQRTYLERRNIFHYIEKWVFEHKEPTEIERTVLTTIKRESTIHYYLDKFSTKIRNL
jgi:hypothetical protein